MRTTKWKQMRTIEYRFIFHDKLPPSLTSPAEVYSNFSYLTRQAVKEKFIVLYLDSANQCKMTETICDGILNSSIVHPREVFAPAIQARCASVILVNNHPSGNPEPSAEDIKMTRQLVESGKILGIPVQDHIIFTDTQYTSFGEKGLM